MKISWRRGILVLGAWSVLAGMIVAGCQTAARNPDARAASETAPSTAPDLAGAAPPTKAKKGGAQLWAETCSHCHNLRSPSSYGPAQWEVAMYDMRVRAHLTGEEQRKILEFLKAASE